MDAGFRHETDMRAKKFFLNIPLIEYTTAVPGLEKFHTTRRSYPYRKRPQAFQTGLRSLEDMKILERRL